VATNVSTVIREVSFSKMEELFLEFNLKRLDDIILDSGVKTITFVNTSAFCRKNFSFHIQKMIFYGYSTRNHETFLLTGILFPCT